jgi:hypothetical protein
MYRMRALAGEQLASETSDPPAKLDWAELAIEWQYAGEFRRKGDWRGAPDRFRITSDTLS